MSDEMTVHGLRTRLEHGEAPAAATVATLAAWAAVGSRPHGGGGRAARRERARLPGARGCGGGVRRRGGAGRAAARGDRNKTIALAHRLHTLAAVRNLVTHRARAGATTLGAFRRAYYSAFEDLIALA